MATKRALIIDAVKTLVAEITVAHDFATDAGAHVYLGEVPELGPDDPSEAIAIVVGDDELGQNRMVRLPIQVVAIGKAVDLDEAWMTIENIVGDIQLALEIEDRTWGSVSKSPIVRGGTRTWPRNAGSTTIGAALTYIATYIDVWGAP